MCPPVLLAVVQGTWWFRFGNREQELSVLVSIISSVLGLLMDGDISWVMDILISLGWVFFSLFRV